MSELEYQAFLDATAPTGAQCPSCDGRGYVSTDCGGGHGDHYTHDADCSDCGGSGVVR